MFHPYPMPEPLPDSEEVKARRRQQLRDLRAQDKAMRHAARLALQATQTAARAKPPKPRKPDRAQAARGAPKLDQWAESTMRGLKFGVTQAERQPSAQLEKLDTELRRLKFYYYLGHAIALALVAVAASVVYFFTR